MNERQHRWPANANFARVETLRAAEQATSLAREARTELRRNPERAETALADITAYLSDIRRLMTEARVGRE